MNDLCCFLVHCQWKKRAKIAEVQSLRAAESGLHLGLKHMPHLYHRGRFWQGQSCSSLCAAQAIDFTLVLCSVAACRDYQQLLGLQRKASETELSAPIFLKLSSLYQPRAHILAKGQVLGRYFSFQKHPLLCTFYHQRGWDRAESTFCRNSSPTHKAPKPLKKQ